MKIFCSLLFASLAFAQPRLFYSDLDSGPATGGLNNNGVFVTVYGKGFGVTQGTSSVTVSGATAVTYQVWSDTKITFQPGAKAQSGNIVVNGSNPLPFTVRAGNIFLVTTTGSDAAAGTFAAPWKTALHALAAIAPGDTVYIRTGAGPVVDDGQGWSSCFTLGGNAGTAGNPKAFVAYPGDTVVWGSTTACTGIRAKGQGESYWTFAGFNISGQTIAVNPYAETGWRIIGNDITCPNGNGQAGCMDIANGGPYFIYGNNIHDVGTNLAPGAVTALYHGVYLSDAVFNVDFGWNTIAKVQGCRGLQENSNSPAADAYGLTIHDNIIHDTQCDGIVMTTVDPSKGAIKLYNNIIYNAGTGPNNAEGSGAWSCMNLQTWDTSASTGSGVIDVYNNTMYNCGTFANPPYGGSNGGILFNGPNATKKLQARNNILYMTGQPYIVNANAVTALTGSNNLFFGNGAPSAGTSLTASLNVDPKFTSASTANFHLLAGSPAAAAGVTVPLATDFDGVPLPQNGAFQIGALAIPGGTPPPPPPPPPPTSTTVIVTATSNADPSKTATSTITLVLTVVTIAVTPASASLKAGQSQQFSATVTGSTSGVAWSMSPSVGTLTAMGLYTAPAVLTAQQTAIITATLATDSTKSASATVTLVPVVAVAVNPASVSLSANGTQQFTATVTGSGNTGVTWTISPLVGSISATGMYVAPAKVGN